MKQLKQPLSNVQLELLKVFSTNLNENDLIDLKQQLAIFYAKKSIDSANKVWIEKGLTNELMDKWLNENGK